MKKSQFFIPFDKKISSKKIPKKFTFPFYYEPHKLSLIAARKLQDYLETQSDFEHNFGLQEHQEGLVIGKMFGVLVCQNAKGELGYLWAFSGKLAGVNQLSYFVPTIFDMLQEDGFFRKEEEVLNSINQQIEVLENSDELQSKTNQLETTKNEATLDIQNQKDKIKRLKIERDEKRNSFENLSSPEIEQLESALSEESKKEISTLKEQKIPIWN